MKWLALVISSALATTALAAPTPASREAYAAGQKLYKAGQYTEAAAKFEAAYAIDSDPAYLFNIAQSYRLAKSCAKAVDFYKRFLDAFPELPAAEQTKVRGFLDEAEKCAAEQARKPVEPVVVAPPVEPQRQPQPIAEPMPKPRDEGRGKRIAGIVTIAAGGAVAASGAYLGLYARNLADERSGLCRAPCEWTPQLDARAKELDDRGDRFATISIVMLAGGGVAIAGGVVLYMLGRKTSNLTVEPTGSGAQVRVTF